MNKQAFLDSPSEEAPSRSLSEGDEAFGAPAVANEHPSEAPERTQVYTRDVRLEALRHRVPHPDVHGFPSLRVASLEANNTTAASNDVHGGARGPDHSGARPAPAELEMPHWDDETVQQVRPDLAAMHPGMDYPGMDEAELDLLEEPTAVYDLPPELLEQCRTGGSTPDVAAARQESLKKLLELEASDVPTLTYEQFAEPDPATSRDEFTEPGTTSPHDHAFENSTAESPPFHSLPTSVSLKAVRRSPVQNGQPSGAPHHTELDVAARTNRRDSALFAVAGLLLMVAGILIGILLAPHLR